MSDRRSPLKLTDQELSRLSPAKVAQAHQDAINRMLTTRRLTFDQWDALLEEWNLDLSDQERAARATVCRDTSHDWVRAPIDARVCRRCLAYTTGDH